jgi:hypothetical protein
MMKNYIYFVNYRYLNGNWRWDRVKGLKLGYTPRSCYFILFGTYADKIKYRLMHQKSFFLISWVFLKKTSTLKTISSVYLTFKHVLSIFHWPSPKPHLTRLFSTHSFSLPFKEQPANCPCKNGGLCVQLPNYQMACSCRYGYTGQACENSKSLVEIDFCESMKKYFL